MWKQIITWKFDSIIILFCVFFNGIFRADQNDRANKVVLTGKILRFLFKLLEMDAVPREYPWNEGILQTARMFDNDM